METLSAPVKLVRSACIAGQVILIDGLTRSGKGMLGPILASLERVEIERVEPILEYVGGIYRLGKIEKDAAIALLRMETDQHLFDGMIGRNVNFRWEDHSSVWHNPWPLRYLRRLFMSERDAAMARVAAERPIYQNMTHRQLANFRLYHEAFGDRLRMLEMVRHPVDLIDSWMRKRKGERIGSDPLINALCLEHRGHSLPYYALGWEEAFLAATPLGRVIRMIEVKSKQYQETYRSLSAEECRGLFMVPFEGFVRFPERYLGPIAEFLGTRPSPKTPRVLKQQRVPRAYDIAARDKKLEGFMAQANEEERVILRSLIQDYEALLPKITR